jgi:ComF family protein
MHIFSAYLSIAKLATVFFPSQCLLCACSLKGELLCTNCQYDLPHSYGQLLCRQCGLRIESLSDFCGHCLRHPPAFSRSFIPFAYQHPLDHLIHKFKYRRSLTSGQLLGEMLADYLKHYAQEHEDWLPPDLIIPAPMHWLRRWQRGFNQAEILGQYVACELGIPLITHIIQRDHKIPAQKELSRLERQKNLRKAFSIAEKNHTHIQGKRIALIDDVVTTTATVRELSQLLMKAGAKDVQVWALARTM